MERRREKSGGAKHSGGQNIQYLPVGVGKSELGLFWEADTELGLFWDAWSSMISYFFLQFLARPCLEAQRFLDLNKILQFCFQNLSPPS